jgi:hypothetical protein
MTRKEYLQRAREFASRGQSRPNAVMTPERVRLIRSGGKTAKEFAEQFGCHYRTVEKVRHYETWVHIDEISS